MIKLLTLLAGCAVCIVLEAYPLGWSDDILLTPEDTIIRWDPDVTVDNYHNVWVVWDTATWVTAEVLFSKRDSLGGALIPETNISTNVSYSFYPCIVVDGSGNIQVVWRETSIPGMGIGHAKMGNSGAITVPSHLAINGAGSYDGSLLPRQVINKYKELNIIWDEAPYGYQQMNYSKLDSMGDSLIGRLRVSPSGFNALWPGIGVDSFANVHMAYRVDDTVTIDHLLYTKLDRDGNVLINNKPLDTGLLPTIIADRSQNIHIVYAHLIQYVGWQIRYLKLDQNGNIKVGPKVISDYENNDVCAHMAMDSLQYLHVVWGRNDYFDLVYAKLDTNGNYVLPPMPVVYPPYALFPYKPRIAVDMSNRLHLVWMDQRLDSAVTADIFYKRGANETAVKEQTVLKTTNDSRISVYPNPFARQVTVNWHSSSNGEIKALAVYDVLGKVVNDFKVDAYHRYIVWFGDDNTGKPLPGGIYFIALNINDKKYMTKVIKLN